MDFREPKCKRCDNSTVCIASSNLYCKCEVCEEWLKNHPCEDDEQYVKSEYIHI